MRRLRSLKQNSEYCQVFSYITAGQYELRTYGPNGGIRPRRNWKRWTVEEWEEWNNLTDTVQMAKRNAEKQLPFGAVYEVRRPIPGDYGHLKSVAWYANSLIQKKKISKDETLDLASGCYIIGRYRVPRKRL